VVLLLIAVMVYMISNELRNIIKEKVKCPHSNNALLCEHCRLDVNKFMKKWKYKKEF